MNERTNAQAHERTNLWTNKPTKGKPTKEQTQERKNARTSEGTNKPANETNARTNKRTNEQTHERTNEGTNPRTNERTNERVNKFRRTDQTKQPQTWGWSRWQSLVRHLCSTRYKYKGINWYMCVSRAYVCISHISHSQFFQKAELHWLTLSLTGYVNVELLCIKNINWRNTIMKVLRFSEL